MNKSEQLIDCLEGEVKSRDARIAELEDDLKCAHSMLGEVSKKGMELRGELARVAQADAHYQAEALRLASQLADTRDKMRAVVAECCEAQEELAAIKGEHNA